MTQGQGRHPEKDASWHDRLFDAITFAQEHLVGVIRDTPLFEDLLAALLALTESEYGFIGEVLHTDEGAPYLKTHAITNIAWNDETRKMYEDNAPTLEFYNLETLFGRVLTTEEPVIAEDPAHDPRRGGLPADHPPLDAFLGLPLHCGGAMIGMIGVANRKGGYDEALVQRLRPFLQTCANSIFALRAEHQRRDATNRLRDEESRMRATLDGVNDSVITLDETGIIQSVNRAARVTFGYSNDEMVGQNVSIIVGKQYRADHHAALQSFVETGHPDILGVERILLGARKDGSEVSIQLTVQETQVGGRRLFVGVARDLSESDQAQKQLAKLRTELATRRLGQMIGRSAPMERLYKEISEIASGNWTVLIEGETGVGKELVVRALQAASPRRNGPFVTSNLPGLSDSLVGSELFGHRRGAFTGASRDHMGLFEAADGGTLFLDEIGDISESVQVALLRVLELGEIVRVGEAIARKVDVRVIAATNCNLEERVRRGVFRDDLFYRLRVARLIVPALRERLDDVPLLIESFLAEARVATGKALTGISPEAMGLLHAHRWPGNVRELRNVIDYASIRCRSSVISPADLPPEVQREEPQEALRTSGPPQDLPRRGPPGRSTLLDALELNNGNRAATARHLGVSRATLYRWLSKLEP